jgi:hypothetical protein
MRNPKQPTVGLPPLARWLFGVGVSLAALAGCDGSISGNDDANGGAGPGPGGGSSSGGSIVGSDPNAAGPRPLYRLTRREYNNTVRDLLGDSTHPADDFPEDRDRSFLFRRAGSVATQDADLLRTTAEALAATAMKTPSSVLPCEASSGEDACAAKFITDFGKRAYRRPLSTDETMRLTALYQNARTTLKMTFNEAITTLLEGMLQSPAFLYHWESPYEAPKLSGAYVQLGAYDVASRLSYFIWGSMPDQELFDAAAGGKLVSDADIATQARRMLADDKAKDAATAFFREWLELAELDHIPKDAKTYPEYTEELKASLVQGTEAFARNVLFESGGKLETLLSADFTFSNQALGKVYGNSATGTTVAKTMLDTSQRLGLLMEPAVLALEGSPTGSNPIKRGKTVYTKLLCGVLPPPPPNVPPAKPASAGGTTRERYAEHGANECARGCHQLMDPIGFAFENYDGIGRYRTMDNGKPVDATGMINLDGVAQPFNNAVDLTRLLATSATVRECFSKQWFRFAVGREETDLDAPSLTAIATAFATNQYDMRDLAPAVAASRSFRYRSLAAGEVTK